MVKKTAAKKTVAKSTALVRQDSNAFIKAEAEKQLGPAGRMAVRATALALRLSHDSILEATNVLGLLKQTRESVEKQRTFFTKPLRDHIKTVEALFRPALQQLEEADDALRSAVITFRQKEQAEAQKRAAEQMVKAQAAEERGQVNKAAALAQSAVAEVQQASVKTAVTDTGSVAIREVLTFEVVDLSLVPREYLTLDERAVRVAVKSGLTEIPGLRIFKKPQLAVSNNGIGAEA